MNRQAQLFADYRRVHERELTRPYDLREIEQSHPTIYGYESEKQLRRLGWLFENAKGSMLDVGCSIGVLVGSYKGGGTGIDVDRGRIWQAKELFPKSKFFVIDAVFGLPFADASFETVVLAEILEHLYMSEAKIVLGEAVRVASDRVLGTLPWAGDDNYNLGDVESPDHQWMVTQDTLDKLFKGFDWQPEFISERQFVCIKIEKGKTCGA